MFFSLWLALSSPDPFSTDGRVSLLLDLAHTIGPCIYNRVHKGSASKYIYIEDQVSQVCQENEQLCLVFVDGVNKPCEIVTSHDQSMDKKER